MKDMYSFVDFFLPHQSNNHRPKILHHTSLLMLLVILFSLLAFLFVVKSSKPTILGLATDITVENLLAETNEERQRNSLNKLELDSKLSSAAFQKAQDMFSRGYWAHNGPDGTTPWVFIKGVGYEYSFAGENLARDFLKSRDVVRAWMVSPKHRENILSENFEDIGFAVVDGKLNGKDTTLVVQMFGKKNKIALTKQSGLSFQNSPTTWNKAETLNPSQAVYGIKLEPLFDINQTTRNVSIAVVGLLLLVLLVDMILARHRKVVRLVGHNFDHILFLSGPLLLSILHLKGSIL